MLAPEVTYIIIIINQDILHSQLLEIAIGNVMTAPVRNSIKLNAVRELHLVS